VWREASCFAVALPPLKEEDANALRYNKPVALHLWLFGYELPGALLLPCGEGSVNLP
jgi:nucleosome binding factor SPN SPT16 subunit